VSGTGVGLLFWWLGGVLLRAMPGRVLWIDLAVLVAGSAAVAADHQVGVGKERIGAAQGRDETPRNGVENRLRKTRGFETARLYRLRKNSFPVLTVSGHDFIDC